jgi:hypothetical protein
MYPRPPTRDYTVYLNVIIYDIGIYCRLSRYLRTYIIYSISSQLGGDAIFAELARLESFRCARLDFRPTL